MVPIGAFADLVRRQVGAPAGRPPVLAVDGRSSGGKTTLAGRLAAAMPGAVVVHTDDVAWWHAAFDWVDLLVEGVLAPVRRGAAVSYRPPKWDERGRPGAIEVPAGASLVVVEGVGAGRRELTGLLDGVVWVQTDPDEAARRDAVARRRRRNHPVELRGVDGRGGPVRGRAAGLGAGVRDGVRLADAAALAGRRGDRPGRPSARRVGG